ncbi:MAG: sensor histidine kinase [Myxococcota bacterium]
MSPTKPENEVALDGPAEPSALRRGRPARIALGFGLSYALVFGTYIVLSSGQAADSAATVEELRRLEILKGLGFVLATAAFFCVGLYALLRRIRKQQRDLMAHRSALVDSERRALAGMLASATAHDIKNVLMYLDVRADQLEKGHPPCEEEFAADLHRTVDELTELANRLMAAGRQEMPGYMETVDLGEVIRDWAEFVQRHADVRRHEVSVRVGDDITMQANASTIGRMIVNLVLNAAQAQERAGRVEIRLRRHDDEAVLEVHDDGPGIPAELREEVFNPFFSQRDGGTGLGLLSVRACAGEHGGDVEVCESDLGGACFRVRLPIR